MVKEKPLSRLRAVSLFPWSVEQNAQDTQMTTRVTEGARRERHGVRRSTFARVLPLLNLKKKSLPFSDCDHCGYEQNLQVSGWSIPKLIRRWMLWSCDHYDIIPETNYPSTEKRLIRLECSDIHVSFPLKMVSGVMIERKTTKNKVGDHKSRTLLTYKKYLA